MSYQVGNAFIKGRGAPGGMETLDDWVWTAWRHLHLPEVAVYSGRVKGHRGATGDYLSSSRPSEEESNTAEKVGETGAGFKTTSHL